MISNSKWKKALPHACWSLLQSLAYRPLFKPQISFGDKFFHWVLWRHMSVCKPAELPVCKRVMKSFRLLARGKGILPSQKSIRVDRQKCILFGKPKIKYSVSTTNSMPHIPSYPGVSTTDGIETLLAFCAKKSAQCVLMQIVEITDCFCSNLNTNSP